MRSVLITGSNRGIGLGIVKYLLTRVNQPSYVIATCRKPEEAKELRVLQTTHKNLHILSLDLTNIESFPNIAQDVMKVTKDDGINLLINNGGVTSKFTTLNYVKPEQIMDNFKVNSLGPIMLTKNLLPLLKTASQKNAKLPMGVERAAVVNMSTILGSIALNDKGGFYPYRCSKTALNAATRSMSVDLKRDSVLVVSMHPGWVKTDMGGQNAPINVETSVEAMFKTLNTFGEEHSGNFYQYNGEKLDW